MRADIHPAFRHLLTGLVSPMIQARNKWIDFCPGESKMDGWENSLHSAYQQQNGQRTVEKAWYKRRNKENKATELTLKNTNRKSEGTQRYLHVWTQGNFLPWQKSLIKSRAQTTARDDKTEGVKLGTQEIWLKPQGDPVAQKRYKAICYFV